MTANPITAVPVVSDFDAVAERNMTFGIWRRWLVATLDAQVIDGSAVDGAFDEHRTGWYDGRYAALTLARLMAAWISREALNADSSRLEEAMQRALAFLLRRQAPDGRLDLAGAYSPNEVGFTLPGLCAGFRRFEASGDQ